MDQPRPNFLLVFPDQWRGDCLSSVGHPVVETPYLSQLAQEGVTFRSAYTPCPSCISARASLITGMTPSSTGRLGYRDRVPWRYEQTLMRCLRDGGYQTMCVGKTHFHPQRAALGFEEMRLYDTQKIDFGFESDYDRWLREKTNGQIVDTTVDMNSNSWLAHPWVHPEHLHPTAWTSTAAIELLERRDPTRPFFMQLGYHRPHPPIDPPLSYYERFANRELPPAPVGDWAAENEGPIVNLQGSTGRLPEQVFARTRRAYYAQLAHLDFQIGRVIWWMQKYGDCFGETYIIFCSDHGEQLGDHHLWRKTTPFEGSAKIPLILKPPKGMQIERGTERYEPVTLCDLMPTILEESGVEIPAAVEGRSLSPLVRGEATGWREYVHGEHSNSAGDNHWQFVTDGREKFVWESRSGREWFFDLRDDPQECRNRAADPNIAERVKLWRGRLIEVLARRPRDGLSDGRRLIAGRRLPPVREVPLA